MKEFAIHYQIDLCSTGSHKNFQVQMLQGGFSIFSAAAVK